MEMVTTYQAWIRGHNGFPSGFTVIQHQGGITIPGIPVDYLLIRDPGYVRLAEFVSAILDLLEPQALQFPL